MARRKHIYTATAVFAALRRLDARQEPFDEADVYKALRQLMKRGPRQPHHISPSWLSEQMLQLQELGFITPEHRGYDIDPKKPRWTLNRQWSYAQGEDDIEWGDDSDDKFDQLPPPPGDGPGGNNGDGDGNGGFRDVLAHPHLFVVSTEDLVDSIERALGRP